MMLYDFRSLYVDNMNDGVPFLYDIWMQRYAMERMVWDMF